MISAQPLIVASDDGVWRLVDGESSGIGLAGRSVSHVATRGGRTLAVVPGEGLYEVGDGGAQQLWEGDARSCAVGPDGVLYVGVEPAMVYRSGDGGVQWQRCDAIDDLPSRGEWTFPPPPHEPHVLSIDFLPGPTGEVLAGVEVGGVLLSADGGETWRELNNGVYVDVHSVRPDPSRAGRLMAVTGSGFYASQDGGATWARRMDGMDHGYTIGLAIDPERAGQVLVSAGDRPPGLNGRVYWSADAGERWQEVRDAALPGRPGRAAAPFFGWGSAWLGYDDGSLYAAGEPMGPWALVASLPAAINGMAAEGRASSVMH